MVEYVIAGNVMIDTVRFPDGRSNRIQLGGPAVFAYSGVKLWTDSCMLVCNVGNNFKEYFSDWVESNKVLTEGIKVKTDLCNHSDLMYMEDGSYTYYNKEDCALLEQIEQLGYMKTSPEEIGEVTKNAGVKGVYLAQNTDELFWDKLGAIKARDGFKLMWEIELTACKYSKLGKFMHALQFADVLSINLSEARLLFNIEDENALIEAMKKLPISMILFRVGERGLYTIQGNVHSLHPSIDSKQILDPTGCGNTSTGSALYAYTEGKDAIMVGIMANVAASENIKQFGVIPEFSSRREGAIQLSKQIYTEYYK